MSDFNTGEWRQRPFFSRNGIYSNVPEPIVRPSFPVPGGFRNTQDPILRNLIGASGGVRSGETVDRAAANARMTADAAARRAGEVVPTPEADPSNPMLDLLYQMFNQAGQGSGGRSVDLSGYNASLKMLGRERKRIKKRYKKYQGQIADIYGTLTGINQSMIENLAPAGEAMRADLSAQEGERAAATRSADAARLEAATQARAGLGLEDLAGQYAGGDVATTQAEGMITDRAADTTAAQNTMLANEAIARQQLTNQNLGRTIQQEQSTATLQRSLEDALAAIRAERANVLTARSQARSSAGGGSGPNLGAQLSILEQIQAIEAGQPATDPVGMFIQQNPSLAPVAGPLINSFADWVSDNYTDLFNRSGTAQKVNPLAAIERFKASSPEARASLNQSPLMLTLLSQYYNSVAAPKAQ
jgi:hypothetical protein